jgi:sulfide:quinone oxidoreductase
MPVASPALGDAVRQMLEQRGISFHPSHKLTAVNAETRELLFEGKSPVTYGMLVAIPPHRSPAVVREAGLSNEAGWIPVDRETLATPHEHVSAIGDVTHVKSIGRGWQLGKVLFEQMRSVRWCVPARRANRMAAAADGSGTTRTGGGRDDAWRPGSRGSQHGPRR